MNRKLLPLSCCILFVLSSVDIVQSQTQHVESFEYWPTDLKIRGSVILVGKEMPESVGEGFRETIDQTEHVSVLFFPGIDQDRNDEVRKLVEECESVDLFELSEETENIPTNVKKSVATSNTVWLVSNSENSKHLAKFLEELKGSLNSAIEAGGTIIAYGQVAGRMGRLTITGSAQVAAVEDGINLIPDTVVEMDYNEGESKQRLLSALAAHPRMVGVGVAPGTAIVLSGRKIRVAGSGTADFYLMANENKPLRFKRMTAPESRRANPYQYLVDLTAWRRDAIDRTIAPFPAEEPDPPSVENGTLFIVGGGGIPDGMMERFVELAGGKDAKLVFVPCSERDEVGSSGGSRFLERLGVDSATVFHTKDRLKANSDDEFLKPLAEATGIWFGGGRQWNFSDSYYGTEAHRLMHKVLERGGVIGGSSAGASIQARYLARANPLGNIDIMAPGYERGGLGFISGVAIDQHFTQRGRQKDMTQLVNQYPQLLGIGIDESTALIVEKSVGEVMGDGQVFFYDRNIPVVPGEPDYMALGDGAKYDLKSREIVEE